jgi:hypothetical protein
LKNIQKFQQTCKIILQNRIFCFRHRHISLFGGSFYKFTGFFISHISQKNE